jgi:hypothetical protein
MRQWSTMFQIKIDRKHKLVVKIALFLVPLVSIALSFFSFPIEIAVSLTVLLVILPITLNWFVFQFNVLHVMPFPTDKMLKNKLGTTWFASDIETMEGLGLMLLFKTKESAKDAFQMFKAWNQGKTIDSIENIVLSAVIEGDGKYSLFLYPGDRFKKLNETKESVKKKMGDKDNVNLSVAKFYMQFCFDYRNDELKTKCIESLPHVDELNLNVGYIQSGEVMPYSKVGFRLKKFILVLRDSELLGAIEKSLGWDDPSGKLPKINQALINQVNQKLSSETSA